MSSSWRTGYIFGATVAVALRVIVYGLSTYGFVMSLINHEIPWWPLILFFTFSSWLRMIGINAIIRNLSTRPAPIATVDPQEIEALVNVYTFRNMFMGGPN
jgi:hypothetical protein